MPNIYYQYLEMSRANIKKAKQIYNMYLLQQYKCVYLIKKRTEYEKL